MKIWQKILLGFLLVFVLISLSGVPVTLYYGRILDEFRNVIDRDLTAINQIEQMEKILLEMDSSARLWQSSGGSEVFIKRFSDNQKRWISVRKQLEEYLVGKSQAVSILEMIDHQSNEWSSSVESIIMNPWNASLSIPVLDSVHPYYEQLLILQKNRLYQSYEVSVTTVQQGEDLAWTLRVVALVVGLLTCGVVIHSVKAPLDKLTLATAEISKGNFESIIPVSQDEIGQLTQAFNQMSVSLKDRTDALEEQRRLAIQANELKTEFLANVSHELRTPLNGIMGYTQLILDGLARDRQEEQSYLKIVKNSSKNLLALINDVLDIARIESGQMKLDLQPVSVKEALIQIEEQMSLEAHKKGLQLIVSKSQMDCFVKAHPGRLNQVLLNLVGNAIKFTNRGEIKVSSKIDDASQRVIFTISDTGIGIPTDKQSRLFQKFVQIDGSMTRQRGGTGLGLVLSKTLLQLMEGTIDLQSEGEGRGVMVNFTLKSCKP